jgi:branched-chain amino acid transport system ATP-binding protein
MLKIDNLDCFYGEVQVLRDVTLELAKGEVLCLMGRNGAGKTTLLLAIMGLMRPRSGRITLDGTDLTSLPAHEVPRQLVVIDAGDDPAGRVYQSLELVE